MPMIPAVGLSGTVIAATPFQNAVIPQVRYTVTAVQTLQGLSAQGVEVYTVYYQPYGLTEQQASADIDSGVMLVSLTSYDGQQLYVPHTYLSVIPDPTGIPYSMRAITVELQMPLPTRLDLSTTMADLELWLLQRLGVTASVSEVGYGPQTLLTAAQDASLIAARAANATDPSSYLQQLTQLRALFDAQSAEYNALQQFVAAHISQLGG